MSALIAQASPFVCFQQVSSLGLMLCHRCDTVWLLPSKQQGMTCLLLN